MKRLIVLTFMFASTALARDCPLTLEDDTFFDKIASLIKAAKSCPKAVEIVDACIHGGTGDGFLTLAAERRCGLDFWTKLNAKEKARYNRQLSRCISDNAETEGTQRVTDTGLCRVSVARRYSNLYTRHDGPK